MVTKDISDIIYISLIKIFIIKFCAFLCLYNLRSVVPCFQQDWPWKERLMMSPYFFIQTKYSLFRVCLRYLNVFLIGYILGLPPFFFFLLVSVVGLSVIFNKNWQDKEFFAGILQRSLSVLIIVFVCVGTTLNSLVKSFPWQLLSQSQHLSCSEESH